MKLKEGIYEQVISNKIHEEIKNRENEINIQKEEIEKEEAKIVLSKYLQEVTKKSLNLMKNKDLNKQIELCNQIINYLSTQVEDEEIKENNIHKNGEILLSIEEKLNKSKIKNNNIRPITPISQSYLFTNSNNEPDLINELKREIASSDSIDILVSFIRWSGLRLIKDDLIEHTKTKKLRIITTSYMGASEFRAIKFLSQLPNTEIKISYDTQRTRLHAKSYMFNRNTGFTTAYIGSSNISKDAMTTGLEWNMKVSEKDSKNIVDKFKATFESYFNDEEFKTFTEADEEKLKIELKKARGKDYKSDKDEIANIDVKGKTTVILGSGGASKAIREVLLDDGAEEVYIVSRNPQDSSEKSENKRVKLINYEQLAELSGYLLVNSTPVGMYPKIGISPVGEEIIEKFEAVVDIVYNPTETEILRKARSLGKISIGGLYMLVGQAVKAEEIFHQVEIDKEIINVIYNELKKEF